MVLCKVCLSLVELTAVISMQRLMHPDGSFT